MGVTRGTRVGMVWAGAEAGVCGFVESHARIIVKVTM